MGRMVELPGDGPPGSGYLAAPDLGAGPALIVIEGRWALADHVGDVCDRYAAEGFTALAPDLSRGGSPPDEADGAGRLMLSLNLEQAAKELGGAIDFLGASDAVRGEGVGVTGFGMGAGLALTLAVQRADAVRACVPFYGLIPWEGATPDWTRLEAPVQGHFAEHDDAFPADEARALEETLHGLGKEAQLFFYPAAHGFFDDTRIEAYDAESARTAWIRTLDFLRSKLG